MLATAVVLLLCVLCVAVRCVCVSEGNGANSFRIKSRKCKHNRAARATATRASTGLGETKNSVINSLYCSYTTPFVDVSIAGVSPRFAE